MILKLARYLVGVTPSANHGAPFSVPWTFPRSTSLRQFSHTRVSTRFLIGINNKNWYLTSRPLNYYIKENLKLLFTAYTSNTVFCNSQSDKIILKCTTFLTDFLFRIFLSNFLIIGIFNFTKKSRFRDNKSQDRNTG